VPPSWRCNPSELVDVLGESPGSRLIATVWRRPEGGALMDTVVEPDTEPEELSPTNVLEVDVPMSRPLDGPVKPSTLWGEPPMGDDSEADREDVFSAAWGTANATVVRRFDAWIRFACSSSAATAGGRRDLIRATLGDSAGDGDRGPSLLAAVVGLSAAALGESAADFALSSAPEPFRASLPLLPTAGSDRCCVSRRPAAGAGARSASDTDLRPNPAAGAGAAAVVGAAWVAILA